MSENMIDSFDFTDEEISTKLRVGRVDPDCVSQVSEYLRVNIRILERFIEGFTLLPECEENIEPDVFMLGLVKMMDLYRNNMEKHDGIMEQYIHEVEFGSIIKNGQPWQYEGNRDTVGRLPGIYGKLINMGLDSGFIDQYYLDGNLIDLCDTSLEIVKSFDNLMKTSAPNTEDLRDGLLVLEGKFRKLYILLFMEKFSGVTGFYSCMKKAVERIISKEKNKNEPDGYNKR